MWILQLNDMRSSKVENISPAVWAESREELETLLKNERVDYYKDGSWGKVFRAGGRLEWFNPPAPDGNAWFHTPAIFCAGTKDQWMQDAARRYEDFQSNIPRA